MSLFGNSVVLPSWVLRILPPEWSSSQESLLPQKDTCTRKLYPFHWQGRVLKPSLQWASSAVCWLQGQASPNGPLSRTLESTHRLIVVRLTVPFILQEKPAPRGGARSAGSPALTGGLALAQAAGLHGPQPGEGGGMGAAGCPRESCAHSQGQPSHLLQCQQP